MPQCISQRFCHLLTPAILQPSFTLIETDIETLYWLEMRYWGIFGLFKVFFLYLWLQCRRLRACRLSGQGGALKGGVGGQVPLCSCNLLCCAMCNMLGSLNNVGVRSQCDLMYCLWILINLLLCLEKSIFRASWWLWTWYSILAALCSAMNGMIGCGGDALHTLGVRSQHTFPHGVRCGVYSTKLS